MGTPLPLPKKGAEPPKFLAHVYCGQMAGWIKKAHGMEVGLSPGDFVLDGDPTHSPKRGLIPSNFWPMFIVAKQLDGSRWHLSQAGQCNYAKHRLSLGDFVLDGDPALRDLWRYQPSRPQRIGI